MNTALRIGIAGALVALSAGMPCLLWRHARLELRAMQDACDRQAGQLSLLVEENARISNLLAQPKPSPPLTSEQLSQLLRLRNERHRLAEQTNLLMRLAAGTPAASQLSPGELEKALAAEMTDAMKRILPALQPALRSYALAHSNQPPDDFSKLQDHFPLVGGRKVAGLQTFEFVRDEGPKPGDALLLRGNVGHQTGDGGEVRVYGFSDGRVVQVSSEDGRFDEWEAQHLNSALFGNEETIVLESEGTLRGRALVAEVGASLGISAEDAGRFFDRIKQQQKGLGERLEEMRQNLTGSPEDKQAQMQAAVQEELNRVASETLGDKGPALVQKLVERK